MFLGVKNLAVLAQIDTQRQQISDTLRIFEERVGAKNYELSNHLGNVLATISDKTIFNTDHYNGIVYSAQLYYPFGWEIPTLSYTAKSYRYGFNGVEKAREIGEGVNTTFYREQDTRAGRWWSFDPRPNAAVSPYAMMENNPIAFSDVLGDTTRVYSVEKGHYLSTVNDNYPNQEVFVKQEKYNIIQALKISENEKGEKFRKDAEYYIGETTRKDMQKIIEDSEAENGGTERFFVFARPRLSFGFLQSSQNDQIIPGELFIFDLSEGITGRTARSIPTTAAINLIGDFKYHHITLEVLGWGHTHPTAAAAGDSEAKRRIMWPSTPNVDLFTNAFSPNDFAALYRNPYTKKMGNNPSILLSKSGYTIYSTMLNPNDGSYELKGSSPLMYEPERLLFLHNNQHYDWKGNLKNNRQKK